jgi:hypothetical protein
LCSVNPQSEFRIPQLSDPLAVLFHRVCGAT